MHLTWKRLQWLKIKRSMWRSRGQIVALLMGMALIVLFWMTRSNQAWMDWFIRAFSAPWKRFWGGLVDPLPFSAAEAVCTVLVLWLGFMAVRTVYQWRVRFQPVLVKRIIGFCAVLVWIYVGFCAFWGVHYYGTGFPEKSGLVAKPVSVEELAATTRWFAEGANRTGDRVPRDENNRFLAQNESLFAYGDACYAQLVNQWPFLDGPHRTPKPAGYSWMMSVAGFTGYLFPFMGESTLNIGAPNVYLPVTIAHEMAHQRGVAPEQEANFLGIAACLSCPDPLYQYSGWLFGYAHLSSALYSADREAWQKINDSLSAGCRADMQWNSEYWNNFSSPVTSLIQNGYSGFLQSYGQTMGLASYGACVDLLVEYYRPQIV